MSTTEGLGTTPGPTPHTTWLLVVGEGEPEVMVWDEPGPYEGDTGYTLFLGENDDEEEAGMACERCTVTLWPHVATAMAVAREHGVATLDEEGAWVAGEED